VMDETLDQLRENLRSDNIETRWHAVEAIRQLGGDDATNTLIEALTHDDGGVRWRAAQALGQLKSKRAFSALVAALGDQKDAVRQHAIIALGEIGDAAAAPALIQVFRQNRKSHHNSRIVADAAIDTLAKLGFAAIQVLSVELQQTCHPYIAFVLQRIQWQPRTLDEQVAFAIALSNGDSLLEIGAFAIPFLKIYLGLADLANQDFLIKMLALLGDEASIRHFITKLKKRDSFIIETIETLAEVGKFQTIIVPILIRLLGSSQKRRERETIADILAALGGEDVVDVIVNEVIIHPGDSLTSVRQLGQLAADKLLENVLSKDGRVRPHVLKLLVELEDVRAAPFVLQALRDKKAQMRRLAAEILGIWRIPDGDVALIDAFNDPALKVVCTAIKSAGSIQAIAAIAPLADKLNDQRMLSGKRVAELAANALRDIGTPEALAALANAAGDSADLS
jgi:HEAT repeat protein